MAEQKPIPIPSPDLLRDIQEVVRWFRAHGKGKLNTAAGDPRKDAFFAPETHLALVPGSGIAGMGHETGTGSESVMTGVDCAIYRADSTGHLSQIGRSEKVYNVYPDELLPGSWTPVTRLKERVWVSLRTPSGGALIAVAPPGGLPSIDNLCILSPETGTGTGMLDPAGNATAVRCNVYQIQGGSIRLLSGGARMIYNLGPKSIGECCIFPVWEDPVGNWMANWFSEEDCGGEQTGTEGCCNRILCAGDGAVYTVHVCGTSVTVTDIEPGCCTSDHPNTPAPTCDAEAFAFRYDCPGLALALDSVSCSTTGKSAQVLVGGTSLCHLPPDESCIPINGVSGTTFDCGSGVLGATWTDTIALTSGNYVFTLTNCGPVWCMAVEKDGALIYQNCLPGQTGDPCSPPPFNYVHFEGLTSSFILPCTITFTGATSCETHCWTDPAKFIGDTNYSVCSLTDPGGFIDDGPCSVVYDCMPFYCVQIDVYDDFSDCTGPILSTGYSCATNWLGADGLCTYPANPVSDVLTILHGPHGADDTCGGCP